MNTSQESIADDTVQNVPPDEKEEEDKEEDVKQIKIEPEVEENTEDIKEEEEMEVSCPPVEEVKVSFNFVKLLDTYTNSIVGN